METELEVHKVFISHHHKLDQAYKNQLVQFGEHHEIFVDHSVDTGDISDDLDDQTIRQKIRDEYLRDSTVTILLVGLETKKRKHVDWELYSSMIDGAKNKKSGILVVNLPSTGCTRVFAGHGDEEKQAVHPDIPNWIQLSRTQLEDRYPYVPVRIIDNLESGAEISIVPWSKLNADNLGILIELAFKDRANTEYDFRTPMRRRNS